MTDAYKDIWEEIEKAGRNTTSAAEHIASGLDVLARRLAAMEARVAERDEQLARLRREMDALVATLRDPPVGGPAWALGRACAVAVNAAFEEAKPCG